MNNTFTILLIAGLMILPGKLEASCNTHVGFSFSFLQSVLEDQEDNQEKEPTISVGSQATEYSPARIGVGPLPKYVEAPHHHHSGTINHSHNRPQTQTKPRRRFEPIPYHPE